MIVLDPNCFNLRGSPLSLFSGSVSLKRYRIVGGKTFPLADLNASLRRYVSDEIALDGIKREEHCGWVLPLASEEDEDDLLAGNYWDLTHCRFADGYLLRMRMERRKVSSELMQMVLRARLNEANRDSKTALTREERRELRENLKIELTQKALPQISYADAYWKEDGTVLLFSTAKRTSILFEDLFSKTFCGLMEGILLPLEPVMFAMTDREWSDEAQLTLKMETVSRLVPFGFSQHQSGLPH